MTDLPIASGIVYKLHPWELHGGLYIGSNPAWLILAKCVASFNLTQHVWQRNGY